MGLFDGIGKKIMQSGQDTVKKAKTLAEITKINSRISEEQRTLTAFYAQIGEKYYSIYKDAPAEEFAQICDRITAGLSRIAELRIELEKQKSERLCPKCGAACPANVQYCAACGALLPHPDQADVTPSDEDNGDSGDSGDSGQTAANQSDNTDNTDNADNA